MKSTLLNMIAVKDLAHSHVHASRDFVHADEIQGGPRKVKPTTILLVTFECIGKIHWFLADVNCIQQEVQDHPNGIIHQV